MKISLTFLDILSISPLLLILGAALGILLLESFAREASKKYSFFLAITALGIALYAAAAAPHSSNPLLTAWLKLDSLACLFTGFFLLIGIAAACLGSSFFFNKQQLSQGEFFFLLLSSVFGLILIGEAADFLTLFLGIETLSISLYVLCLYVKKWSFSSEASIKYFFMGAVASGILLYGIALIYGAIGTTRFDALLPGYKNLSTHADTLLFLSGIALVTVALAFEAAIVPFHIWAPDVYEGAPTPVTAFMAVGTKTGAYAAFVRVFLEALPHFNPLWNEGIAFLAYPTLIYANYLALRQVELRRFFAYSSISHAGFLLIPLAAATPGAVSSLLFYLAIYGIATMGVFAVLAFIDDHTLGINLKHLRGLFKRSPLLAGFLALCLLTLAGIPPTAGFFAKFYIFKEAFEAGYYALVIVGLLTTILSAYYYLRIIAVTLTETPEEETPPPMLWPAAVIGSLSVIVIIAVSCYPAPLMDLLHVLL